MSTFINDKITEDKCPFCDASGISMGVLNSDDDYIYVENECPECHIMWTDFYTADNQSYWSCPACGSNDLEVNGIEADGNIAWTNVECLDCHEIFDEQYSYVESEQRA